MSELGWRNSWEDSDGEDYTCIADGESIGRVYPKSSAMLRTSWGWFAHFHVIPNSGTANSRREAMLAIEERWEAFRPAAQG